MFDTIWFFWRYQKVRNAYIVNSFFFKSRFSNSPESGIGTSQPSITDDIDSYPDPEFENEYEYNEEFSAVLGTGRALYPFTGRNLFESLPFDLFY